MGRYCCFCDKKMDICNCEFDDWNDAFKIFPEKNDTYETIMITESGDRITEEQRFYLKKQKKGVTWNGEDYFLHWELEEEGKIVTHWREIISS